MRNPKWARDELILALDLYFKLDPSQMHANNKEIIALSELLNKLPIHSGKETMEKFRNPNGVGLKLNNFKAIDPNYPGKGMKRGGRLDREIFEEFKDDKDLLGKIARRIKETVSDEKLQPKLYQIPAEEEELSEVKEGTVLYKVHRVRERDPKITKRKKDQARQKTGKLACEVCGFDFELTYGELGSGYIECHHIKPLSEYDTSSSTKLKDLALVCANCHRMLHRKISTMSMEDLKKLLR